MTPRADVLAQVDLLLVMAPGGRAAWFGPPAEASAWFGVQRPAQPFAALAHTPDRDWHAAFRDSDAYRKYVLTRQFVLGLDELAPERGIAAPKAPRGRRLRQLAIVTARTLRTKLRDRGAMAVLLAQAPVLGARRGSACCRRSGSARRRWCWVPSWRSSASSCAPLRTRRCR